MAAQIKGLMLLSFSPFLKSTLLSVRANVRMLFGWFKVEFSAGNFFLKIFSALHLFAICSLTEVCHGPYFQFCVNGHGGSSQADEAGYKHILRSDWLPLHAYLKWNNSILALFIYFLLFWVLNWRCFNVAFEVTFIRYLLLLVLCL